MKPYPANTTSKPFFLTVWNNDKFTAFETEQYVHHTKGDAIECGIETCQDFNGGYYAVVEVNPSAGTSKMAHEGWHSPPVEIDEDHPYSDPNREHSTLNHTQQGIAR